MNKEKNIEEIIKTIQIPEGIIIREFEKSDFPLVQQLYKKEGWMTFINRSDDALNAFMDSNIMLIACKEHEIVAAIRGITDGYITTYISELLVDVNYRRKGLGKTLLEVCHYLYPKTRIDILASEGAQKFYENEHYKKQIGYRKSSAKIHKEVTE